MEKERSIAEDVRIVEVTTSGPTQPRIDTVMIKASNKAHRKLIVTAYELAMTPTMPLEHFIVLVNVQKQNGVRLIKGENERTLNLHIIQAISL